MAQNFNNHQGTPHGSPPPHSTNGFDLMGTLISSSPATPLQHGCAPPWPLQAGWPHNRAQSNFTYNMPYQGPSLNQMTWTSNNQDGYIQFPQDEDELTVDDTNMSGHNGQQANANGGISGNMQILQHQQQLQPGQLPSLSSSSPLALPPPRLRGGSVAGQPPATKSPMVNSAARAAELRAKLLASRGSVVSRQGSPAVKTTELSDEKKTHLLDILKQAKREPGLESKVQVSSENTTIGAPAGEQTNERSSLQAPDASPARTATSLSGAIDNLMAEARDATDDPQKQMVSTNGDLVDSHIGSSGDLVTNGIEQAESASNRLRPTVNKSRSSPELSEPGEILSERASPTGAERPQPPKTSESDQAAQANREKQEKLARQNEVKKAYQPLKKSKAPKSEAKSTQVKELPALKQVTAQTNQQARKSSFDRRGGDYERPPIREESRREQFRDRARDYDRRDDDRDLRRPSISQTYPSPYDLERDVAARRQKLTDENARRAAEYKKNLDANRAKANQSAQENTRPRENQQQETGAKKPTIAPTADASRKDSITSSEVANNGFGIGEQDSDTVMLSPRAQPVEGDADVNDWLELTEFYDQQYRERRLQRFRKKKALDLQRAEVEREEELELQERSMRSRAQSTLPVNTLPPAQRRPSIVNVRMLPPPLPLSQREANKEVGLKIKDSALSAGLAASQTSSPTLKRQHAEDDIETSRMQSMDKKARLEMNGHSSDDRPLTSPTSARGERPSVKGEPLPLESRMSRYDDWPPPRGRPRSRSPEYRRRSLSPRRRRFSQDYSPPPPPGRFRDYSNGPRRPDERMCFNCNQHGHVQGQCTEPRKDGREWGPTSGYQSYGSSKYVSPNYRGKYPLTKPPPPANSRSRYNSIGRIEDGDADKDNGGGGVGGQSR